MIIRNCFLLVINECGLFRNLWRETYANQSLDIMNRILFNFILVLFIFHKHPFSYGFVRNSVTEFY